MVCQRPIFPFRRFTNKSNVIQSKAKNLEYINVGVTEILRYALDDKMIGSFYFDTIPY